jgi:hypothetical protein
VLNGLVDGITRVRGMDRVPTIVYNGELYRGNDAFDLVENFPHVFQVVDTHTTSTVSPSPTEYLTNSTLKELGTISQNLHMTLLQCRRGPPI